MERAIDQRFVLNLGLCPGGVRGSYWLRIPRQSSIFLFGCQYAGLVPVPLPLSVNFGGRAAYESV